MAKTIKHSYNPNAKQILFHESDADECVYGGAKGGGKSCALIMEAMAYGLDYPGAEIYLFRETYDDLEANLIKEWKQKVPKSLYKYREGKFQATMTNGTTVKFRHMANYQVAQTYDGRSMDFIGVDELTRHEERSIQVLLSCLRSPKGFPPRFRGTCNPGGIGHNWVKARYITATGYGQQTYRDEITDSLIQFIPAKVTDNVVLMKNDPAYVKRLRNLPEAKRKAYLDGDWDIFEGQYFPEFKGETHVIKPFKPPAQWNHFRSLDYGLDMTSCYWWATDEDGTCYIYRELNEKGLILSMAAQRIVEMTPPDENIQYTVASPDLWNRRQDTGESGFEIMVQNGLTHLIKANNRRVPGWRALREYLQLRTDRFGLKKPMIQFCANCTTIINHLPQLQHDERNPEDAAGQPHEITHAPESIRYGIMSRPQFAVIPKEKPRDDLNARRVEVDNFRPEVTESYVDSFNNY